MAARGNATLNSPSLYDDIGGQAGVLQVRLNGLRFLLPCYQTINMITYDHDVCYVSLTFLVTFKFCSLLMIVYLLSAKVEALPSFKSVLNVVAAS